MVLGLICFGFSDGGNLFWGEGMRVLIVLPKIYPSEGVENCLFKKLKLYYI